MTTPQPFTAQIPEEAIAELRARILGTRWPDAETCDGWDQGVPLAYAQELANYWATDYDWRRAEARLNRWAQYRIDLTVDGQAYGIHYIHRRSPHAHARPLILTHGWPGSVFDFGSVIDQLAEPESYGGDPADAFHVIVPSLPGYGFSAKPTQSGTSVERIADIWNALMLGLGYAQYFAQGGDWGSLVTSCIGQRHSEHCAGIHLNMVLAVPDLETFPDVSDAERRAFAASKHYQKWDGGYSKQQSTRPQTLGYALADSPVGQMTWIIEKFWSWTDCERDGVKHPENALSRDDMLDTVSLYWFSNAAASSARLYWESYSAANLEPVTLPMGGTLFPKEIFLSSERWARQRFPGMVYWHEVAKGGHFAALEQPEVFTTELRNCFGRMR